MKNRSVPTHSRGIADRRRRLIASLLLCAGIHGGMAGAIDDAATRGVWKVKYGVTDVQLADIGWQNLDTDGDGMKNIDEAAAGTDPFKAGEVVKITTITADATQVHLTFPTVANKLYVAQASTSLSVAFENVTPTVSVAGNGSPKTLDVTKGPNKFFRVLVQDVDADGDGLSDWVEVQTGRNPNSITPADKAADYAFVTQQLTLPHKVNIMATSSFASEDGPTSGTFTVTRTQKLLPITVSLTTTGSTATITTDYNVVPGTYLPGSITFNSGEDSKDIYVNPVVNPAVRGSKSVKATIVAPPPGSTFDLGANSDATVIIGDSTTPAGTGLTARYYDNANSIGDSAINFGENANYAYTRAGVSPNFTGTVVITPTGLSAQRLADVLAAITAGTTQVKLSFTGGNLNTATYNHLNYPVTAKTASTFTCTLPPGAGLPATSSSTCGFSVQPVHPAVIERVDPTVNFEWMGGTPNGVAVSVPAGGTQSNYPDNYSDTFEMYLSPATGGSYRFQLDADDKARVLLDLNGDGILQDPGEQILEHGWDTAATGSPGDGVADDETVGTFKISSSYSLTVPASPAQRYKMRVEHVETTGEARCRLQWSLNGGGFGNISQGEQFTHTQAATYTWARTTTTTGTATVTLAGHGLSNSNSVAIAFSSGNLFTPNTSDPAGYSNPSFTVANAAANTFDVAVTGTSLPATNATAASCFIENRSGSTTTGVYNKTYTTTNFTNTPGRVGVDAAVTASNNGLWGTGTPSEALINPDTFSVRWSGQLQPQFSEDYTIAVLADDGCTLRINGQVQELKTSPSTITGTATYLYDNVSGDLVVNYTGTAVKPGAYIVGETARIDPSSGNLTHPNGSTYTYVSSTGNAVIDYSNLTTVTPGSYAVGQFVELDPTAGTASSLSNLRYPITASTATTFTVSFGAGVFADQSTAATVNITDNRDAVVTSVHASGTGSYNYSSTTGDAVIDYTALGIPSNTVAVGNVLALDPSSGNLNALPLAFATVTAATPTTFTVNYGIGTAATGTGNIIIVAPSSAGVNASITTAFTVNVGTGKYANGSTGNANLEIVNKPLKDWSSMGNERYCRIPMIGGVRYDIQLDYWESGGFSRCILYWYSPSQPKQVIPQERLYPSTGVTQQPPLHISPTDATAMVGGAFALPVSGSNSGTVTISGNPAWLTYSGGVLGGTPPAETSGDYQITITITNSAGISTSVVNLHVDENAGTVVREYWNGVSGTTVASLSNVIAAGTAPTGTANLTSLEAPTDFGDNYGARVRGYIEAPTTGNYYFWIAANNAAELWISNDDEQVNIFRRAYVAAGSATPQTWNAAVTQKSAWLALEQGKKYYFEILHKAGAGAGDNLAVGWSKPGQPTTAPSEIVPGYVLSPFVAPAASVTPGSLYAATLLAQGGAVTNGVGTSSLRLNADETVAYMRYAYSNLTGPITSQHIHTDPYQAHASTIVYDIDTPATPGDGLITDSSDPNYGSYKWTITPVGTLTAADIRAIIKEGKSYINLHTAAYPNGEIRGNFFFANASGVFTPPPAPSSWSDDGNTDAGAARFLAQATFGANIADIAALKALSPSGTTNSRYETWLNNQFVVAQTQHLPEVLAREIGDVFGPFDVKVSFDTWWKTSMTAPDQLRQRIAFALSEIHVVSGQGPLEDNSRGISDFYDTLAANAFGNFRDVLIGTTLTPAMGRYLDMLRNDKPDLSVGRSPNENYAREIKQLFSIGLYRMWPDGSLMLTSKDTLIDTYTQREIVGLAHVFTGWDYGYDGVPHTGFSASADWTRPMREVPVRHFTGQKRVLNNEVLPGLPTVGGQTLDPYATHTSPQFNDAAYVALPSQEDDAVHEMLFNHPNTGPFICRQLIQRLVTSNPSRDYLYRVVQKFNDNGSGVRGDMKAVIKAILLDYEARSPAMLTAAGYGKQREPIMRVANAARALRPANVAGSYSQTGGPTILITTSTPHLLAAGNAVFLEFTDATGAGAQPAPSTGTYTVLSTSSTPPAPANPTATSYYIAAPGLMYGTYSQTAGSSTMTVTMSNHYLPGTNASQSSLPSANYGQAYFDFLSATTGTLPSDGIRTTVSSTSFDTPSGVGNITGTTFTVTAPDTTARTGTLMISRFPGSYSCTGRNGVITIDTGISGTVGANNFGGTANHGLAVGSTVFLNFTNSRDTTSFNETSTENDLAYTITGVPDPNTFTVAARDAANAAMNSDNQAVVFPLVAEPVTRNGTINTRQSTFVMDNTDIDLQQTPLNSPTVFNFFLPDYKYAGTMAAQNITTPEFQLTSETTAIRQANFFYSGVFNPGNTTGLCSFKTGSNALVMDLSPWMATTAADLGLGIPDNSAAGVSWTHNQNVSKLVDHLNTLLAAGQVPASATDIIKNFIATRISSIGTSASACLVTTTTPHKLATGDSVVISGVTNGTFGGVANSLNNTSTSRVVTVTGATDGTSTTFTIPLSCTVAPNAGGLSNAHVSVIPFNQGGVTDSQKRDRLRNIIHLILTSSDYTIQR